ncbi:hypothetical protein E3P99_03333 [Wallemia hederae]|uniref:DUF1640 domain-containing protein n=1 Tax=Wallemia hederae TaxID=1540922 RepID=A0A4T0FFQ6_9BASI|nr:hypothetical protein E3P99_03333 [Wallemia hederae]
MSKFILNTRQPIFRSIRTYVTSPPNSTAFDTHGFVKRLEQEGVPKQQAEGIMMGLSNVIDESVRNMAADMVSRAEHDRNHYTQKVDFAALKSEIQLHEKSDLTSLKSENERLMGDVEKLKQRLREEITRTQAGVRLDLNLEKGRIRDESSVQELKLKEVAARMESEVAAVRTQMESSKMALLQYIIGILTGGGALLLAYLRLIR